MAGAGAWVRPKWYSKDTCGTTVHGVDHMDRQRIRSAASSIELELRNMGYLPPDIKPDGLFRQTTHMAIAEFQHDVGLRADGAAGPLTLKELFKAVVLWEQNMGRIKIPGGYLHGQIMLESLYDPGAEGVATDNGVDRGIVQLNSRSYPQITAHMAYSSPRTGIAISANRMREARRRQTDELSYADQGRWDCAILDHNWPVAADFLYDTNGSWLLTDQELEDGVIPEEGRAAKYVRRVKTRGATF